MKTNKNFCSISAVIVGCVVLASMAAAKLFPMRQQIQKKEVPALQRTTQKPLPKPFPVMCPDLTVTGMDVTLVSTELGKPGVEFPTDKVMVSVTVANIGNAKLVKQPPPPAGGYVICQLNLERNKQNIGGFGIPELSPGDSHVIKREDNFPHGVKTIYRAVIITGASECRMDNNEMSITVDEAKLHPTIALPDLVPVNKWPNFGEHGFCKLNNGKLEVTIKNQGEADAPLSTTKVVLSSGKSVELPTSSIPKGGSAILLIDLPENCFSCPDCSFTITADSYNVIRESDEGNNGVHGRCYPY